MVIITPLMSVIQKICDILIPYSNHIFLFLLVNFPIIVSPLLYHHSFFVKFVSHIIIIFFMIIRESLSRNHSNISEYDFINLTLEPLRSIYFIKSKYTLSSVTVHILNTLYALISFATSHNDVEVNPTANS